MGRRGFSPRVGVLALLGIFAVVSTSGTAGAKEEDKPPTVLPSIQLTTDNNPVRIHNQPQVLVDPTDDRRVVVLETDASVGECWLHVSRDRGRTWTTRDSHPTPP